MDINNVEIRTPTRIFNFTRRGLYPRLQTVSTLSLGFAKVEGYEEEIFSFGFVLSVQVDKLAQ